METRFSSKIVFYIYCSSKMPLVAANLDVRGRPNSTHDYEYDTIDKQDENVSGNLVTTGSV